MADTLAEIYRDTLTESDFNSSGEATIVTTDSSTSHVIKSIQVKDTDTKLPVGGTLDINGFDIVGLTANSSGTEIIAPSSTVKVKATGLPLTYTDDEFNVRTSGSNYSTTSVASVNGVEILDEVFDGTNALGHGLTYDNTRNVFAPFVGSNHYIYTTNHNSSSTARVIANATGSSVHSHNNAYTPKWFDGKQYAYYYDGSVSPRGLYRMDIAAGSTSLIAANDTGTNGGDSKIFGVKDEYIWYWSSSGETMSMYTYATNSIATFGSGNADQVYSTWHHNRGMYAVKRSTGSYRFIVPYSSGSIRYVDWNVGDVHASGLAYTSLSLGVSSQQFREYQSNHSTVGSKLYYVNDDSEKVAYVDFAPETPTLAVIGTNQLTSAYGFDLTHVERTPSASAVAARTYGVNPSLKLRITGVTST
jgi:hypothetical protein